MRLTAEIRLCGRTRRGGWFNTDEQMYLFTKQTTSSGNAAPRQLAESTLEARSSGKSASGVQMNKYKQKAAIVETHQVCSNQAFAAKKDERVIRLRIFQESAFKPGSSGFPMLTPIPCSIKFGHVHMRGGTNPLPDSWPLQFSGDHFDG